MQNLENLIQELPDEINNIIESYVHFNLVFLEGVKEVFPFGTKIALQKEETLEIDGEIMLNGLLFSYVTSLDGDYLLTEEIAGNRWTLIKKDGTFAEFWIDEDSKGHTICLPGKRIAAVFMGEDCDPLRIFDFGFHLIGATTFPIKSIRRLFPVGIGKIGVITKTQTMILDINTMEIQEKWTEHMNAVIYTPNDLICISDSWIYTKPNNKLILNAHPWTRAILLPCNRLLIWDVLGKRLLLYDLDDGMQWDAFKLPPNIDIISRMLYHNNTVYIAYHENET